MADPLVSTAWLADHLGAPDVRLIDASWYFPQEGKNPLEQFRLAHIPGAVFFDIDEIADDSSNLPHMLPSPVKFASRVRKLGLGDGSRMVVYDQLGLRSAARVWWTFRAMGHEDVVVLDGGLPKWIAEGRPIADGPPQPRERHFTVRYSNDLVRDLGQVKRALASGKEQLVDARPAGRFTGETPEPREGLRGGHMPGAFSVPASEILSPDGTVKSAEQLKEIFEKAGVDLNRPIITTCGSGITAAMLSLALARIGKDRVPVYDGSWTEWGGRQDTDVVTGGGLIGAQGMDEESRLIRAGAGRKPTAKTVAPAIQRGSTVLLPDAKALYDGTFGYGRSGLNAQHALCEALCELEGAREVQLFPSGLAAVTAALMAVLKAGDHILVVDTVYKPVRQFCDAVLTRFGVAIDYYDARLDAEALLALATPATRLILLESPGSLTFEVQDVPGIAAAARARGVLTLIDNTWGAGLLFKPLAHGVDLSVQALTKYVCGHSDVFMGSVAVNDRKLAAAMQDAVHEHGWAVTGDDAYQALRGLRTLAVRMARHGENGLAVARWLEAQPQVLRVIHPALPGDAGHALWSRDYSGACGLFAVVLRPGPDKAVEAFLDALKLFGLGFSWGGFESLAINCDPQFKRRRIKVDYGGPVIRLHVGLESPGDLIADLEGALAAFATR